MNLRTVDLNLLVILDALLDEAHVSRAARRVGLSQPAVSAALHRCRHLFRDALLERGRGAMRPTPKAESLRAPLKSLLAEVTRLVDPPAMPLAELRQTVRMVMSDHRVVVLAPLLERLRDTAPGIDLVFLPWHGSAATREALARGDADLTLSPFRQEAAGFIRRRVIDERYVVLMRGGHPATAGFDLERWLAFPHVVVSGRGDAETVLDRQLAGLGRTRRIGLVVPSFLMVPPLVARSDYLAMVPFHGVPELVTGGFTALEPPIPVEGFPLHLAWHSRRDGDPAVRHVAALIESIVAA